MQVLKSNACCTFIVFTSVLRELFLDNLHLNLFYFSARVEWCELEERFCLLIE